MPEIFNKVDKLKPIYDKTYHVIMLLCKLMLIADILITSYAVLGRYVHKYIPVITDPKWSEEIVLTLMSYMAVLSAALAIRRNAHIRMSAFDRYLHPVLLKVLDILSDACVLAFGIIMLVVGWKYARTIGSRGSFISLPKLSKFWMYFPIPLAGAAVIIFEIEKIYEHIRSFWEKDYTGGEKEVD